MDVTSKAEAISRVHSNFDVKAFILHMLVDLGACVPLSELNALCMSLYDFLNQILHADLSTGSTLLEPVMLILVSGQEVQTDFCP